MIEFLKSIPVTLGLTTAAILLFVFPEFGDLLEYDTSSLPLQQPIQWLGCHLLHWSSSHLFWDLGMFALLGAICERIDFKRYGGLLLLAAFAIPVSVAFSNPELSTYRGLSGLDTALFAMATVHLGLERLKDKDTAGLLIYVALFLAMTFKIGNELTSGTTRFVEGNEFTPVPIAHAVGAVLGCLIALVRSTTCESLDRRQPSQLPA